LIAMAGIEMRESFYPGRAPMDAYGNGGFRFADMSHRGSILCLPSGIHAWEPVNAQALVAGDFAKFFREASTIEVLLIGLGHEPTPLPRALRDALRDARLKFDIMSTGAAVGTFNVLVGEDRAVAAALIAV
jgi:uncharacterized protein